MSARRQITTHPQQRALERYGIVLDMPGLRAVAARLAAGEGMLLRRSPRDGSEVRVIRVEGQLVTVAFDPVSGIIKTFKPRVGQKIRGGRAPAVAAEGRAP